MCYTAAGGGVAHLINIIIVIISIIINIIIDIISTCPSVQCWYMPLSAGAAILHHQYYVSYLPLIS